MRTLGQGTVRLIHHLLCRIHITTVHGIQIVRVTLRLSREGILPAKIFLDIQYPTDYTNGRSSASGLTRFTGPGD